MVPPAFNMGGHGQILSEAARRKGNDEAVGSRQQAAGTTTTDESNCSSLLISLSLGNVADLP
jgi:hypothetical protein